MGFVQNMRGKIKKMHGNYAELIAKLGMPKVFLEQYAADKLMPEIKKDIARTVFYPTRHYTYEHFRQAWLNNPDAAFTQGNMDSAVFPISIITSFAMKDPEKYEHLLSNRKDLRFAYFDQTGSLCGYTLCYSSETPEQWCICIMRNTQAAPEEREVFVYTAEELTPVQEDELLEPEEAFGEILQALDSRDVQELLLKNGGVLQFTPHKEGHRLAVDPERVKSLRSVIEPNHTHELLKIISGAYQKEKPEDIEHIIPLIYLLRRCDAELLKTITQEDLTQLVQNPQHCRLFENKKVICPARNHQLLVEQLQQILTQHYDNCAKLSEHHDIPPEEYEYKRNQLWHKLQLQITQLSEKIEFQLVAPEVESIKESQQRLRGELQRNKSADSKETPRSGPGVS